MHSRNPTELGLELIELAHALDSARIVVDLERSRSFGSPRDVREAVRAVAATVGLIGGRLRQLGVALAAEPPPRPSAGARPSRKRRRQGRG